MVVRRAVYAWPVGCATVNNDFFWESRYQTASGNWLILRRRSGLLIELDEPSRTRHGDPAPGRSGSTRALEHRVVLREGGSWCGFACGRGGCASERFFRTFGAVVFPTFTHTLRRGLHSCAAARLTCAGVFPPNPCKHECHVQTGRPPDSRRDAGATCGYARLIPLVAQTSAGRSLGF